MNSMVLLLSSFRLTGLSFVHVVHKVRPGRLVPKGKPFGGCWNKFFFTLHA